MADLKKKILIVDDDKAIHIATKYILKDKYDCVSAYNGDEGKIILQNQRVDLVLLDLRMRREDEGLEYLPQFKEIEPDLDVVIVSSNNEIEYASRAIKAGASAYLLKEHSADQLHMTIQSVLSRRELVHENQHYVRDRKRVLEKHQIVGQSNAIKQLMKDIEKVRRSPANAIIVAETGCGKELVARHIGAVDGKPFIAVDSATITSTMAESILFGHEKGAFTGAHSQQKGLFEEANGGTIYFDEIANMPLEIQAKLLRVIQEKEVTRLGSTKTIPLNFRVICATNKDFDQLIAEGKFKDDLFQRLNVIQLRIPALRERKDDIGVLVEYFLRMHRCEGSPECISDEAMKVLSNYTWPGNVRELSNLMANLCTMVTDHETIELDDLPAKMRSEGFLKSLPTAPMPSTGLEQFVANAEALIGEAGMDFYKYMHALEGQVLSELYKKYQGNISQMSKKLIMSRSHLYSKLYAHQIHKQ